MPKKYVIELEEEERANLKTMVSKGKAAARMIQHAHVLLQADSAVGAPAWKDEQIAETFDLHIRTVSRIRQRFVEHGLDDALRRRLQPHGRKPRLDGVGQAQLTQIACSEPPEGRQRWTLRLLADRLVQLEVVDEISHETIRQALKKTPLLRNLWLYKCNTFSSIPADHCMLRPLYERLLTALGHFRNIWAPRRSTTGPLPCRVSGQSKRPQIRILTAYSPCSTKVIVSGPRWYRREHSLQRAVSYLV